MRGILHQSYVRNPRFHAYAWTSVSNSRICVSQEHREQSTAYALPSSQPTHASESPHAYASAVKAYAWSSISESRCAQLNFSREVKNPRICVDISLPPTHM
ncbi:hypothetical protein PIB30_112498, partial [Stylosanthes scabra]|nr:hypothetical protein [Stylosanthes scabra]